MTRPVSRAHASWLNGTIAGLAMKEAMTRAGPVIIERWQTQDSSLEASRLAALLLLCLRSYMVIEDHFSEVYEPDKGESPPATSYAVDLLWGFVHLLFLSLCAISIDRAPAWLFFVIVEVVLISPVVWWVASRRLSTSPRVGAWAAINGAIALLALAVGAMTLWIVGRYTPAPVGELPYGYAELVALLFVSFACLVDIAGIARGRSALETYLEGVLVMLADFFLRAARAISARRLG